MDHDICNPGDVTDRTEIGVDYYNYICKSYSNKISDSSVRAETPTRTMDVSSGESHDEGKCQQPRTADSAERVLCTSKSGMDESGDYIQMGQAEPIMGPGMVGLDTKKEEQLSGSGGHVISDHHADSDDSIQTDSLGYFIPRVSTETPTIFMGHENKYENEIRDFLTEKVIALKRSKLELLRTYQKQFALFLREEYMDLDVCLHEISDSALVLKGHKEHIEKEDFIEKFLTKCMSMVSKSMKQLEIQLLLNTSVQKYVNEKLIDLHLDCFWACGEDGVTIDVFSQWKTVALDGAIMISQCLCKWSITVNDQINADATKEVICDDLEMQYKDMFVWQQLKSSGSDTEGEIFQFNFVSLNSIMPKIKSSIKSVLCVGSSRPHRAEMICYPAESIGRDIFIGLAQRFKSTVTIKEGFISKSRPTLADRYCYLLGDDKRILLQQGSISDSDSDVILCPVDNMHTAVGAGELIFEKIGDEVIQDIFKQLWNVLKKRSTLLNENRPHFTEAACRNIESRYVMFAVLPAVQESKGSICNSIRKAVTNLLETSDKHICRSVAVPVDYTPSISMRELVTAFTTSLKRFQKPLKHVKELRFVVSSEDCLNCLHEELLTCEDVILPKPTTMHVLDLTDCQLEDNSSAKISTSPIDIEVFHGDLVHSDLVQNMDMLVNSVGCRGDMLRGAISKALIKEGGSLIRQEFEEKVTDGLRFGEVVLTGAGNLQCKKICHVLLYNKWDTTGDFSVKILRSVIIKTLRQAENEHCISLGIPALGTGFLGYPIKEVINMIYNTIEMYGRCHSATCIRRVLLAVKKSDDVFNEALQNVLDYQEARQLHKGIQFYSQNVGINPGLDTRFHFWETVDRDTGVVIRVAPDFPLGVYFSIDVVYTLKETSLSLSQERSLPKVHFDRSDNIYKMEVETPKIGDKKGGVTKTLKECMTHAQIQKYMSVAFQLHTHDPDEIHKICILISKLITKVTDRGSRAPKYSILIDRDIDIKNIAKLQGGQLHFRRKCRFTDQYMEAGILISVKSKSRSTYEQIRREIENRVNVIATAYFRNYHTS